MFPITSWLLLFSVLSSSQVERPSYEAAYRQAQKEHKPLLIVVGAEWCAACKTLKAQTIEPMQNSGKLENVIVTVVDKDLRPDLAEKLMDGKMLPQLVVFTEGPEGWKKFSVTGIQTEGRVKELLIKAASETAPRAAMKVSTEVSVSPR
jgi:thioredoxin-like negative regulator of GroEL